MLAPRRDLDTFFPDDGHILTALRDEDGYFRNLASRYGEVDDAIHRIETTIDADSHERLQRLRRQRKEMLAEVTALIIMRRNLN